MNNNKFTVSKSRVEELIAEETEAILAEMKVSFGELDEEDVPTIDQMPQLGPAKQSVIDMFGIPSTEPGLNDENFSILIRAYNDIIRRNTGCVTKEQEKVIKSLFGTVPQGVGICEEGSGTDFQRFAASKLGDTQGKPQVPVDQVTKPKPAVSDDQSGMTPQASDVTKKIQRGLITFNDDKYVPILTSDDTYKKDILGVDGLFGERTERAVTEFYKEIKKRRPGGKNFLEYIENILKDIEATNAAKGSEGADGASTPAAGGAAGGGTSTVGTGGAIDTDTPIELNPERLEKLNSFKQQTGYTDSDIATLVKNKNIRDEKEIKSIIQDSWEKAIGKKLFAYVMPATEIVNNYFLGEPIMDGDNFKELKSYPLSYNYLDFIDIESPNFKNIKYITGTRKEINAKIGLPEDDQEFDLTTEQINQLYNIATPIADRKGVLLKDLGQREAFKAKLKRYKDETGLTNKAILHLLTKKDLIKNPIAEEDIDVEELRDFNTIRAEDIITIPDSVIVITNYNNIPLEKKFAEKLLKEKVKTDATSVKEALEKEIIIGFPNKKETKPLGEVFPNIENQIEDVTKATVEKSRRDADITKGINLLATLKERSSYFKEFGKKDKQIPDYDDYIGTVNGYVDQLLTADGESWYGFGDPTIDISKKQQIIKKAYDEFKGKTVLSQENDNLELYDAFYLFYLLLMQQKEVLQTNLQPLSADQKANGVQELSSEDTEAIKQKIKFLDQIINSEPFVSYPYYGLEDPAGLEAEKYKRYIKSLKYSIGKQDMDNQIESIAKEILGSGDAGTIEQIKQKGANLWQEATSIFKDLATDTVPALAKAIADMAPYAIGLFGLKTVFKLFESKTKYKIKKEKLEEIINEEINNVLAEVSDTELQDKADSEKKDLKKSAIIKGIQKGVDSTKKIFSKTPADIPPEPYEPLTRTATAVKMAKNIGRSSGIFGGVGAVIDYGIYLNKSDLEKLNSDPELKEKLDKFLESDEMSEKLEELYNIAAQNKKNPEYDKNKNVFLTDTERRQIYGEIKAEVASEFIKNYTGRQTGRAIGSGFGSWGGFVAGSAATEALLGAGALAFGIGTGGAGFAALALLAGGVGGVLTSNIAGEGFGQLGAAVGSKADPAENPEAMKEKINKILDQKIDKLIDDALKQAARGGQVNITKEAIKKEWERQKQFYPNNNVDALFAALRSLSAVELYKQKLRAARNQEQSGNIDNAHDKATEIIDKSQQNVEKSISDSIAKTKWPVGVPRPRPQPKQTVKAVNSSETLS